MNLTPTHLAQLRLARTRGVGPVTFRKAVRQFGGVEGALAASARWLKADQPLASVENVQREVEALNKLGGTMVLWGFEGYPAALAELPDPPLVLSVLGDATLLHRRQVALVGNRNASAAGLAWSRDLATALARAGICVTSGLARGIDTAAHEGALAGNGPTVAVVAGGVDNIYPPENGVLRQRMIAAGAVVSEQALGMVPTASLFPRRNRIIAGLSVGIAVSEATKNSGSLITAQCALDYGREVWAVPGSPSDPRAGGPNWLLKNGATLVECVADILQDIPATPAPYVPRAKAVQPSLLEERFALDETEDTPSLPASPRQTVYELLGRTPMAGDELIRASGLPDAALTMLLVELELEGHAVREGDGRWRRG
ncbi:MAG: DNA-processing protein DprA [Alphaproteobacteria bacterium]